jgi:hypothetical protein
MAQAQVVISGVDRTQAAINSALRGMRTLERTARVTSKAINFAFGFLTGSAIIGAFKKITDAAKKTEEGQKSLLELNRALKDPALIAAAESLTNALVSGFTAAILEAAKFIKFVRRELISLGMLGPSGTAMDAAAVIKGQIANKTILAGQMGAAGQLTNVQIINEEIAALRRQLILVDSLASAEAKRDSERIDAELRAEVAIKNLQEVTIKSQKNTTGAMSKLVEEYNNKTRGAIANTVAEFAAFEAMIDSLQLSGEEKTARMMERLNEILPEVEITGKKFFPDLEKTTDRMSEFAKTAASNIQTAFANFLFDPFQDGLRGMLSGFMEVIRRMIAEVAAQEILLAIFSPFKGQAGFFGRMYRNLEGRAMGGPVSSNTPYIVGERGPELFVPNSSGSVVPNNKMGGVTVAPVYNIDARGATADLQKALPGILQENNRRIFDELDRRYGIGR